ncbi:glycosyltransferase family 2 protein [Commensalibacter oyaizuii]|uniref:Glycosyltransferase family 2 protein n=1 Tax=Commensalibacter oyaizuii TaxID=3043873 RepID=A0ABT6Q097_9PROT|nr:glycosyltransferase family 2 protein [Commensalibacter sp. TBRC 16381]MDI2090393.1 glycosyltransferase family 2 protein [Commensalibacter sp. TBRC 16381]
MSKVAVALFVKNERADIAGWIAWYQAFGIDRLYIFDDHSTDGTYEILQAAAKLYDIQLFRTNPIDQPNFYWRQRDAFMAAASMAKGQYDWIGFFDADEYVYLTDHDRFSDFLDQFPHADAVAINWCIYGNAKRVLFPKGHVVETFTYHSSMMLGDNQQVKSFIRPEKLGGNYINPHQFDVDMKKYVDTEGNNFEWRGPNKDITWSGAKVMHFICRSMEHYVERIRRRKSDLGDSFEHWQCFSLPYINMQDQNPLRMMPLVNKHFIQIEEQLWQYARHKMEEEIFKAALSFHSVPYNIPASSFSQQSLYDRLKKQIQGESDKPIVVRLTNGHKRHLYISNYSQKLMFASDLEAEIKYLLPIYGIVFPYLPNSIILTVLFEKKYHSTPFAIDGQLLLFFEHYFRPIYLSDMQKYALTSLYDEKLLGYSAENTQSVFLYDRSAKKEDMNDLWDLEVCYQDQNLIDDNIKVDLIDHQTTLKELLSVLTMIPHHNYREFIRLCVHLNDCERAKLNTLLPGILSRFLE